MIYWGFKKQRTVTQSNIKSENKNVNNATAEFIYIEALFLDLELHLQHSSLLWGNNSIPVYLIKNVVFLTWTKNIEINYHFVHECVFTKKLLIKIIHSYDQPVDILINGLPASAIDASKAQA